ncbi:MAG: hypothetical protein IKU07_02680, partial [Oscillospiraceae bacterium]|nr:hypothetical protein [Oscillospiraceae bacterium]
MLSLSAFNALLKIIEEPPEHLLFILATTELHKVPATILSRCQRFSFRRISQEDIAARLQYVAYEEQIDMDDSAARVLARLADGGMRDGLSLLDQCASATDGELTAERVYACLGIAGIRQSGELMGCIARHDTGAALSIMSKLYADGKDMGALLDELACLTRDFMILKTAPQEGITMLSGVAADDETKELAEQFSSGELLRMMNCIQTTVAGFTRSESRRLDAELCIVNLCQPELDTDVESMLARLTRIEDQLKSGSFVMAGAAVMQPEQKAEAVPVASEAVVKKDLAAEIKDEAPVGFWTDLAASLRAELSPAMVGFFGTTPNSPLRGVLSGDVFYLVCVNDFIIEIINKPEVIQLVTLKASAALGRPVRVCITDKSMSGDKASHLEQLLDFGRAHSNVVTIKDSE